jgi:uroporphyrinogen-III synthase
LLTDLGATVVSLPTIVIADPLSFSELDVALRGLQTSAYEWIVFLSANAVTQVMKRLRALSLDTRTISRARVVAVGRATARSLASWGVSVDLLPESFTAASAAEALGEGSGRLLVPRAQDAPADALDSLRSHGWQVDEVIAYRTLLAPEKGRVQVLKEHEFDVVTFTSGSTARGLSSLITPAEAGLSPGDAGSQRVVCIGPQTAKVARELGFRVDAVASEHSAEGLVRAVVMLQSGSVRGTGDDGGMAP